MTALEPRASDVSAMRDAILNAGVVRLTADEVWLLWCRAVPRLTGVAEQQQILIRTLELLGEAEVVELPTSPRSRMTATRPPRHITVPTARRAVRVRPWTRYPWRRELGWISSLSHVADEVFDDLVAINIWLAGAGDRSIPIVPVRYRSAEIFDREKRLEELGRSQFFGAERLTFEMLSCRRIAPPLAAAPIGDGPDVLVVENSDTYWVALDALGRLDGHGVGIVAWGSGRSFPSQVPSLALDICGRGPVQGTVWYWGDYDPAGIDIAVAAARASEAVRVEPAVDLWIAMADVGLQGVGEYDWSRTDGADWLGAEVWGQLRHVRTARGRIAQERVPVGVVTSWARQLS